MSDNHETLAKRIYENLICDWNIAYLEAGDPEIKNIDFRATVENADRLGGFLLTNCPKAYEEFTPVPTTDTEFLGWNIKEIADNYDTEQLEASIAFAKSQGNWLENEDRVTEYRTE